MKNPFFDISHIHLIANNLEYPYVSLLDLGRIFMIIAVNDPQTMFCETLVPQDVHNFLEGKIQGQISLGNSRIDNVTHASFLQDFLVFHV